MQRARAVIGAVLAGGGSRRMGRDKARLEMGGLTLVERAANALRAHLDEVVVVSARKGDHADLGAPEIADRFVDKGPLGGIHAALRHASPRPVLALACDLPRVGSELIAYLLEHGLPRLDGGTGTRVVAVAAGGRAQPLCGLYAAGCVDPLERRLRSNELRVLDFAEAVGLETLPLTQELPFFRADLLSNVNEPAEARALGVGAPAREERG